MVEKRENFNSPEMETLENAGDKIRYVLYAALAVFLTFALIVLMAAPLVGV